MSLLRVCLWISYISIKLFKISHKSIMRRQICQLWNWALEVEVWRSQKKLCFCSNDWIIMTIHSDNYRRIWKHFIVWSAIILRSKFKLENKWTITWTDQYLYISTGFHLISQFFTFLILSYIFSISTIFFTKNLIILSFS